MNKKGPKDAACSFKAGTDTTLEKPHKVWWFLNLKKNIGRMLLQWLSLRNRASLTECVLGQFLTAKPPKTILVA